MIEKQDIQLILPAQPACSPSSRKCTTFSGSRSTSTELQSGHLITMGWLSQPATATRKILSQSRQWNLGSSMILGNGRSHLARLEMAQLHCQAGKMFARTVPRRHRHRSTFFGCRTEVREKLWKRRERNNYESEQRDEECNSVPVFAKPNVRRA